MIIIIIISPITTTTQQQQQQTPIVDRAVANLYVSKGKYELQIGDAHAAKISFLLALELTHKSNRPSFAQFLKANIRILLAQSHAEIGDIKNSQKYLDVKLI